MSCLLQKKKILLVSVSGRFRPGIEPGTFECQSNCLTTGITKYPHDLASTASAQKCLFIVITLARMMQFCVTSLSFLSTTFVTDFVSRV